MRKNTPDYFWKKVIKTPTCWIWTGYVLKSGYATVWMNSKRILVHRYSYSSMNGKIPPNLEIDHLCFTRLCVRPDHLEAVTRAINNRRKADRKTTCPSGHPFSGSNLFINCENARCCKICTKIAYRKWFKKKRNNN